VRRQPQRPCALLNHQGKGDPPERAAEAELEIHEAPGERQAIQEHERDETGDLHASLDGALDRRRAADDQQLADQIEQPRRRLDADEAAETRHQEVHRQIGNEPPMHLIERLRLGGAVARQQEHAREMVLIIDHGRRNGEAQHRPERGGEQQCEDHGGIAEPLDDAARDGRLPRAGCDCRRPVHALVP
jgi:hypothetical protein